MKEKININNYEEFFLAYLDGELSDKEIAEFEAFLLSYPKLREELEGLEKVSLQPEAQSFTFKENLLKIDLDLPVTEANFAFFCIAEMEGDLGLIHKEEFETYLENHPGAREEREIIRKTKLNADTQLRYKKKFQLKKFVFSSYRKDFYVAAGVAAGIALMLTLRVSFIRENPEINTLAVTEEKEVITTQAPDSSLEKNPGSNELKREQKPSILNKPVKETKRVIRETKSSISFKTGIPVADKGKMEIHDTPASVIDDITKEPLFISQSLDTRFVSNFSPVEPVVNHKVRPLPNPYVNNSLRLQDPSDFMSLQELALTRLSEMVFKDPEKELNAITLASAGINKINEVTGTEMKVETKELNEGKKKVLSFNSRLISFSTPINRED